MKILLVTAEGSDRIALTTTAGEAAWDGDGNLGFVREASAVINARVGTSPEELRRMVESALRAAARERGVFGNSAGSGIVCTVAAPAAGLASGELGLLNTLALD